MVETGSTSTSSTEVSTTCTSGVAIHTTPWYCINDNHSIRHTTGNPVCKPGNKKKEYDARQGFTEIKCK